MVQRTLHTKSKDYCNLNKFSTSFSNSRNLFVVAALFLKWIKAKYDHFVLLGANWNTVNQSKNAPTVSWHPSTCKFSSFLPNNFYIWRSTKEGFICTSPRWFSLTSFILEWHPMKAWIKEIYKIWADVADKICFSHT